MSRPAIGIGAAASAWIGVLVALNMATGPFPTLVAFTFLCSLAIANDQRRLVMISLVVGLGMLLLVPGIAIVDGSLQVAVAGASMPESASEWIDAAASALRVPAQVVAIVFFTMVPSRLLLAGAARTSPQAALLGAMAARLRPLLARDAQVVADELESRGLRLGRGAPAAERMRAVIAVWEALMSGLLDRAFITAAALEARGWGRAKPTEADLTHPDLVDGSTRSARIDGIVVLLSIVTVGLVRLDGHVAAAGSIAATTLVAWCAPRPRARLQHGQSSGEHERSDEARWSPRLAVDDSGLVLDRVSMRHPGAARPSLVDASMVVRPGELVVVVGRSGSGKSTLLDVVSGIAPATTGGVRSGSIRLGDIVLGARRGRDDPYVSAVFQYPESQVIVGHVAEEVAFGLRHAGVPLDEIEPRVIEALDLLDIRHLSARDCSTLSGGELQRVLLAAALVVRPSMLVLDEPTSQVDATTERRFWDVVDRVRHARGIGVLVAEHRLGHLIDRADRFVLVDQGNVVADVRAVDARSSLAALLANPYAQLVPRAIDAVAPVRLQVHVDRLRAGGDDSRTLLRGLGFAARAGTVVTLEGPNGTGKSTLLKAIRGYVPGASVQVDAHVVGDVGASVRSLAWLSQGAGALVPGRTIEAAAVETSTRLGHAPEQAFDALVAAGLSDRRGCHPSELSVGQRQRLALVVATAHRPTVWLLDEPTRGMDPQSRRWVAQHVLAHANAGGIVLIATHDSELAAAVATHRLRLDHRTAPSLLAVRRDATGRVIDVQADATALQTPPGVITP